MHQLLLLLVLRNCSESCSSSDGVGGDQENEIEISGISAGFNQPKNANIKASCTRGYNLIIFAKFFPASLIHSTLKNRQKTL